MSERDPLFLPGLCLVVVLDVLLVYVVLGLPGVIAGALLVHLGVLRIERRRARAAGAGQRAEAHSPH